MKFYLATPKIKPNSGLTVRDGSFGADVWIIKRTNT